MVSIQNYVPPNKKNWQGRQDAPLGSAFFQIIEPINLLENNLLPAYKSAFAILGFACDEGIRRNLGRVGAVEGPDKLRQVLGKMPVHDQDIIIFDAGNILCLNQDLEGAQAALSEAVAILLNHSIIPIVIGGGHELAYGHFQGIAKRVGNERLDIINCDAHLDMRPLSENKQSTSGTPFLQIAKLCEANSLSFHYHCLGVQKTGNTKDLFATAKKYNVDMLFAEDIHNKTADYIDNYLTQILKEAKHIYLTLCLDVFASAFAPGVSASQPYGLTPYQIIPAVRKLAESSKVISYDIAELSPVFDRDNATAKLAAHFVYEIIHHHKFLGN